jgi:hypothetical protein
MYSNTQELSKNSDTWWSDGYQPSIFSICGQNFYLSAHCPKSVQMVSTGANQCI